MTARVIFRLGIEKFGRNYNAFGLKGKEIFCEISVQAA